MDTSDSEDCFESADEDFSSDEEPPISKIHKKTHKTKLESKDIEIDNNTIIDGKNNNLEVTEQPSKSNLDNQKIHTKNIENKNPIIKIATDIQDATNEVTKSEVQRPEFAIPPTRVQCWEPGMQNYENKNSSTSNNESDDHSKTSINVNKTEHIDSANIEPGCCFPGSFEAGKKPVECTIEDIKITKVKEKENVSKKTDNSNLETVKTKPLESESRKNVNKDILNPNINKFPEIPTVGTTELTECWEPGLNEPVVEIKNKSTEIGLFVSEISSKKSLNIKNKPTTSPSLNKSKVEEVEDMWGDEEGWGIEYQDEQSPSNIKSEIKPDLPKGNTILKKIEEKKKENSDEDLWKENENWGSIEEKGETNKEFVDDMWKDNADWGSSKKKLNAESEDLCKSDSAWEKEEKESIKIVTKKATEEDLWKADFNWDEEDKKDEKNEENLWEDEDDWQVEDKPEVQMKSEEKSIAKALDNIKIKESDTWGGGWGNWGISSVLSTAVNLTSTVSQSFTTVIGVPDPEELARQHKVEKEKLKEESKPPTLNQPSEGTQSTPFGLGNLVSGVTKLVETTGTKVISGGLDTLEILGKKTMEVLSENDPGLKKKRAFLKLDGNKPVLSQILREAKEKAEQENKESEKQHCTKKANYETLFDDHQGLVHLEALEMLSKQCDIKLETILSKSVDKALRDIQETMEQVKELCELPEEDEEETLGTEDIKEKLESAVADINIPITYKELLSLWEETEIWMENGENYNENDIHQRAIETLARLTAISVEQFHKTGELLLIKEHRSTADEADSLVQLTVILSGLISIAASKFSERLTTLASRSGNKENINSLITNVFFEAANSSRYIQDAFQLLIPVLQVGAI